MGKTAEDLTTKERMLEAAVDRLAKDGPARFKPHEVCAELGISKALVNYHFGNRDGLIAEATVRAYERYVEALAVAIAQAGDDPLDQIAAWIDRQVEWTTENPGIAIALNFPYEATEETLALSPEHVARLRASGARNQQQLYRCYLNLVRRERGTEPDPADLNLIANAALIGWTALGLSVWQAGRHVPTSDYRDLDLAAVVRERIRERILQSARGDEPASAAT